MRSFSAPFITAKNADFAKPALLGTFKFPLGTIRVCDLHHEIPIGGQTYQGLVESWGTLGASLQGFGEAFAAASTTVTILNARVFQGKRLSYYLDRYLKRTFAELFWAFEDPDAPGTYYLETALKGPLSDAVWDYQRATLTVVSQAEELMARDVLKVADMDWTGLPESNVGRALPLVVNAADRVPLWIYGEDRSKLLAAEDVRPAVLSYTFGARYFRGVEVTETETSLGVTAPEI